MTSTDSKCPFMVLVGTTEHRQRVFIIAASVAGLPRGKGAVLHWLPDTRLTSF